MLTLIDSWLVTCVITLRFHVEIFQGLAFKKNSPEVDREGSEKGETRLNLREDHCYKIHFKSDKGYQDMIRS